MIEKELQIYEEDWGLHIVAKSGLRVDNENLLPRIKQVIELAKSKGKNRLLISASLAEREVSIVNLFHAGELLLELHTVGFQIAFVAPHLADNKESRFMENVGENRGTYIRYFSDPDKALSWLKH